MPWFTKKERRMQVSAFSAIFKADFGRFRCVSACFGRFLACFGRRPIWPDMADTARFWPNQPGSTWIKADSARIEPHRRESSQVGANPRKKKKKTQTRSDVRATALDAGAAPLVPRLCFLGHHFIGNVTGNCNFQVVFMFHNYIHLFRKRRERWQIICIICF